MNPDYEVQTEIVIGKAGKTRISPKDWEAVGKAGDLLCLVLIHIKFETMMFDELLTTLKYYGKLVNFRLK